MAYTSRETAGDFGKKLYTFGLVADVQGGDKPDNKFKFYRYASIPSDKMALVSL
jgi:hypothetical protein